MDVSVNASAVRQMETAKVSLPPSGTRVQGPNRVFAAIRPALASTLGLRPVPAPSISHSGLAQLPSGTDGHA
jgi:hypothetical protein